MRKRWRLSLKVEVTAKGFTVRFAAEYL